MFYSDAVGCNKVILWNLYKNFTDQTVLNSFIFSETKQSLDSNHCSVSNSVNQLSIGWEENSSVFSCRVWTEREKEKQIWVETLLLSAKLTCKASFHQRVSKTHRPIIRAFCLHEQKLKGADYQYFYCAVES